MIVITAELWPGGDKTKRQLLGVLTLTNDGSSTRQTKGNYQALVSRKPARHIPLREQTQVVWKQTRITNFRRKRFGVWYLLTQALLKMGFSNPEALAPS